jgi:hypothetical protein
LFRSDGTNAGTKLVKELKPGNLWAVPTQFSAVNGTLVYPVTYEVSSGFKSWSFVVGPSVHPDTQRISVTNNYTSDVVFQHTSGAMHLWGVLGGNLTLTQPLGNLGANWKVKEVGDLDGAGPDGLVLRDVSGFNRYLRLSNTGATLQVHDLPPAGLNWDIAAVGDFDGDGRDDILWREVAGYNHMYFAFDRSTSAVTQSAVAGLSTDWKVAAVADFDGDGKADIFWRNINGANAIWLMNGPKVKQVLNVAGLGIDWTLAAVADFDRDGRPDLLWRNIAGYNGIWFMKRNVVDRVMDIPGVTPDWRIVGTGDYDGDGFADILWEQNVTATRVEWLLNAGAYHSEAVLPGAGEPGWHVVNPKSNR